MNRTVKGHEQIINQISVRVMDELDCGAELAHIKRERLIGILQEAKQMDINAFWRVVLSKKREALPSYFCDGAIIRWHCSNERFTVAEYVRANCDYPGEWDGEIERVEETGDTVILAGHVFPTDKSASYHVVSFIRLKNGKISELDEYWADDGDAPMWRRAMKIGEPIR